MNVARPASFSAPLRLCVSLAIALPWVSAMFAAQPAWWTDDQTKIIDPNASHAVSDNYAPANLGQLKNVAKKAKAHLDANLPGGAGSAIDALVGGFSTINVTDNYAPINLGQLKAVAKPFYDRLLEAGYDTHANLVAHGFTGAGTYPWNQATPASENYAITNVGQLKMAFSFDLGAPAGQLPTWWQNYYYFAGTDPNADPDDDGLSNLEEYLGHTDPTDFWNGQPPVLTIVSGNNQGDLPGQTLSQPLTVNLTNTNGAPSPTGGVSFMPPLGGGSLSSSGMTSPGLHYVSLTLPSGPAASGITITVKAQSTNVYGSAEVTFSASVGDPGNDPIAPGKPEITSDHGSTEALVRWEDRSDNETAFYVERTADGDSWIRVATLPRNTTSYTDTGLAPDLVYFYRIISHNDASP
ncbi:MAG: fibronectin type III domain-containing protein [Terrimicrobiaceae bacterium]|nr:fibronectin type III domain-containing protein [Terrimicrobiaceae bacterium]